MRYLPICAVALLFVAAAFGQPATAERGPSASIQRVPPEQILHHVYAVVPLQGTGAKGDAKRPMFAPSASDVAAVKPGTRPAILSWKMQVSDDGKYALVDFAAATPADLKFIVTSNAAGLKAFETGKTTKAEVEAEFRKYKKDFSADQFIGSGL